MIRGQIAQDRFCQKDAGSRLFRPLWIRLTAAIVLLTITSVTTSSADAFKGYLRNPPTNVLLRLVKTYPSSTLQPTPTDYYLYRRQADAFLYWKTGNRAAFERGVAATATNNFAAARIGNRYQTLQPANSEELIMREYLDEGFPTTIHNEAKPTVVRHEAGTDWILMFGIDLAPDKMSWDGVAFGVTNAAETTQGRLHITDGRVERAVWTNTIRSQHPSRTPEVREHVVIYRYGTDEKTQGYPTGWTKWYSRNGAKPFLSSEVQLLHVEVGIGTDLQTGFDLRQLTGAVPTLFAEEKGDRTFLKQPDGEWRPVLRHDDPELVASRRLDQFRWMYWTGAIVLTVLPVALVGLSLWRRRCIDKARLVRQRRTQL